MVPRSVLVIALAAICVAPGARLAAADARVTSDARARASAHVVRRPNLPDGWTWPPNAATRRDGRRCLRELRATGVHFKPARRRRMVATPVVVPDMTFGPVTLRSTYRKPPFVMDCRLARALATYASTLSALGIRELHFSSIHDFRRVRLHHRVQRPLSRHSLGLAIDVFEVVMEGGAKLVVKKDYWTSPALMVAELALRATSTWRSRSRSRRASPLARAARGEIAPATA